AEAPPVPQRSGKFYESERVRVASMTAASSSAAEAPRRQLPVPPARRRSETAAASADVGVQESAEEKSRREYLARRAEVYGSIDDEEEVSAEAPPVPQRAGEFYERGRAASIAAAASSSADRVRRRQLPVPPARRRSETAADFMAETSLGDDGQEDAPPALAGYLARRGMMPSPVEQGGDDASQMSRIGGVQASLEESIDRYSQGYIALESFNPRISGFANFLDGLIETGRHNEAIMLVVLYGDQYLAPKQERVEGSPGRDFKDTKQFLKSSSDFIKSPAGVAALGQMLEEGLEFKDVMKVFASLKHVSNELNNKHLEEEKSQRRGTLSRAVGRLLSVSKRPPAAEASASGEQINFDCCETEIFTGFLSQLIERAEPANLLSLIKTLQTASEVSKSRPGDNSLFGLKDAIVLQKAITEYTKRAAPSLRPATTNVGDPSAVGSQAAIHRSTPR
ncbi:MAG: hypothetical protein EBZ47_08110, partial [Chlamydiae bacterium]|nr:hypothetical protein [Chlamydiota bacterium]